MISIYTLTDPRNGAVRYVGQTRNPERRLVLHGRPSYANTPKFAAWIRSLRRRGMSPRLDVIGTVTINGRPNYIEAEKFAIGFYAEAGARLFNQMSVPKQARAAFVRALRK